jgi:hypothetical protein
MKTIFKRNLIWLSLSFALMATACVFSKSANSEPDSPSKKTSTSRESTAPFTPSNDARKDLRDALEKLNTAYPYRLTEVSTGSANGAEMPTRVVDFAAANRSHAKWTNGPLGDTEVITIDDKKYTKLNNGKWIEEAATSPVRREGTAERMRDLLAKVIKDVKYVGAETVNGVPCYAYAYTIDGELGGQRWAGTGKSWIGASDGLPHQLDSELNTSSYQAKSHITYEYNVDIKVEKPAM